MQDSGVVISVQGKLAQIQVDCSRACSDCSASSLCKGPQQSEGRLAVKNTLNATPGDEVTIEIPETDYNRSLILLFGTLLLASVAGAVAGYLLAAPFSLSPSQTGSVGFILGLGAAIPGLVRYFRKANLASLYPVILDITKKGDCHG
jgi:positive regulator of sigma E activity